MSSNLYQTPQQTWQARILFLSVLGLTILFLILFARGRPLNANTLTLMLNDSGCWTAMLLILTMPVTWLMNQRWPTGEAYAVTDERLLYRKRERVETLSLKDLPSIRLIHGKAKAGSIVFGSSLFPDWNVKDVGDVYQVIVEAQRQRLQDLNA